MNRNQIKSFNQFLNFSSSQKEVSLVVAKDEEELGLFFDLLLTENFVESKNMFELTESVLIPAKTVMVLNDLPDNNLWSFLCQYPTGQIQVFSSEQMRSVIISPSYRELSVVFLITKKNLKKFISEGFNLLAFVGLTYQN